MSNLRLAHKVCNERRATMAVEEYVRLGLRPKLPVSIKKAIAIREEAKARSFRRQAILAMIRGETAS